MREKSKPQYELAAYMRKWILLKKVSFSSKAETDDLISYAGRDNVQIKLDGYYQ